MRRATTVLRLQARDVEIVEAVHRLRVLRTDQLAALFFPTAEGDISSACRTRLRLLTEAGYLHRGEVPQVRAEGRRPYVYMLTAAGCELLTAELGLGPEELDWKPAYNNVSWPFLAHQLAINDAYLAFSRAVARTGWRIDRWVDDRLLRQQHTDRVRLIDTDGREHEVAVVPDAFFVLTDGIAVLQFFLEIDRATMTVAAQSRRVKSWQQRIQAYQAYFVSEAIQLRYHTNRIRVLTITTTTERLGNLKQATEAVGGRKRYWFATADDVRPEAIIARPVWQIASANGFHTLLQTSG